jgi:tetratricopeptide (TPR) repeat protein
VQDNDEVRKIRKALMEHPDDDGELDIKLGDALSYQLRYIEAISAYTNAIKKQPKGIAGYQKRGGRYLTTLQLRRAYEDFTICRSFGINAEIELLSGLTAYMRKEYKTAKGHFDKWISIAADDIEELIAIIFWYILCCVKDNDAKGMHDMLSLYSPNMNVGHHTAYKCGIELFRGDITADAALKMAEDAEGEDRDLEYNMIVYAVANYEYYQGNTENYIQLLDAVLLRDTFWAGFASLAALNDRNPEAGTRNEIIAVS